MGEGDLYILAPFGNKKYYATPLVVPSEGDLVTLISIGNKGKYVAAKIGIPAEDDITLLLPIGNKKQYVPIVPCPSLSEDNVVLNPKFADGLDNWTVGGTGIVEVQTDTIGCFKSWVHIGGSSGSYPTIHQDIDMTGKTKLSFRTRSVGLNFFVRIDGGVSKQATGYSETEWTYYEYDLTDLIADPTGVHELMFHTFYVTGNHYLTHVRIW